MIYKKYGEIFKKLRKQRNIPLTYFEDIGISKSALGKFENGESMMSFDRLLLALQSLHISLEEFELHLNKFSLNDIENILDEIFILSVKQDSDKLYLLSKELEEIHYTILATVSYMALQSIESNFTDTSISINLNLKEIKDFLYNTQLWGYYEMGVLFHSVPYLEVKEIVHFLNTCLTSNKIFFNIPKYRTKLLDLSYRSINVLISKNEKDLSWYLLNKVKKANVLHSMANKNFQNLTLAYWNYQFIDHIKGKKQMKKCIHFIQEMENPDMANYILKIYRNL